jgi:hypothetical protein
MSWCLPKLTTSKHGYKLITYSIQDSKDKDDKAGKKEPGTPVCSGPASLWVLWNDADIAEYMTDCVPRDQFYKC